MLFTVNVEFKKEIFKIEDNQITVGLSLKPIKNQANKELVKKLSKYFKVPTSKIIIKSGHKSKTKIIEIYLEK